MENKFDGGWIYVMMTSSDYNRFKLGRTRGNPLVRFKQLRTADPGLGLEAAYFVPALHGKVSHIESFIHRHFGRRISFHDESLSEWFSGSARWACESLETLFEDFEEGSVASIQLIDKHRICRAYEEDLVNFFGPIPKLRPIDGLPM